MDGEKIGTSAVTSYISKTGFLVAQINEGDKEPSWDGAIYLYKNANAKKKKEDLCGRVYVQVKSKGAETLLKPKIKYHISRVDLSNYLTQGVAFFVVYYNVNGDTQIYYSLLSPIRVKTLLSQIGSHQGKNVEFSMIPIDDKEFTSLVMNFYEDCVKQASFAASTTFTKKELKNIKQSVINIQCYGNSKEDFLKYPFSYPVCIYEKGPDNYPDIPVEYGQISQFQYSVNKEVVINDKVYYRTFVVTRGNGSTQLSLGKSFTLTYENDMPGKVSFTLNGNLSERINDMSFILDFIQSDKMMVGGRPFMIGPKGNLPDIDAKIEHFNKHFEYLTNLQKIAEILHIKEEFDFQKGSQETDDAIKVLTDVLINKKPHNGFSDSSFKLCHATIYDVYLPLAFIKGQNGDNDNFVNILGDPFDVYIKDKCGSVFTTTQYILLTQSSYCHISDIHYDNILQSLMATVNEGIIAEQVNFALLFILSAYDQNPQKSGLLSMATSLAEWLLNNRESIPLPIRQINYLQTVKRTREYSAEETQLLHQIVNDKKGSEEAITSAYLLLDDIPKAKKHYAKIKDKKTYEEYPIFRFMTNSNNQNNG